MKAAFCFWGRFGLAARRREKRQLQPANLQARLDLRRIASELFWRQPDFREKPPPPPPVSLNFGRDAMEPAWQFFD
jgi:hypothetical protein